MARGINKVILIGNCGSDPEQRFMPSGGSVTRLSVATSENWKDRESGERRERTEWHRVVFFGRLAEIAKEYLRKGSKVYIEGSLRTSSYEKNGEKRYSTEVIANEMQMLDSRGGGGEQAASGGGWGGADSDPWAASSSQPAGQPQQQQPVTPLPDDDDIPF